LESVAGANSSSTEAAVTHARTREGKRLGRSDRYPSDYGERDREKALQEPKSKKPSKRVSNIDEQGERANVAQNTPPKGLRIKR
jgi:hypothetical protein